MADLKHLRGKTVILKMAGAGRAVSTGIVNEEDDGLWFSSQALIGELKGAHPAIPEGMAKNHAVFVPYSQMQFLVIENI